MVRLERTSRRANDLPAEPHAGAGGAKKNEQCEYREPTKEAFDAAKLLEKPREARNEG
jgi:hypothetical protein